MLIGGSYVLLMAPAIVVSAYIGLGTALRAMRAPKTRLRRPMRRWSPTHRTLGAGALFSRTRSRTERSTLAKPAIPARCVQALPWDILRAHPVTSLTSMGSSFVCRKRRGLTA